VKQVTATIIDSHPFPLEPHRSGNRILSSFQLIWLNCLSIASEARPGQFVMVRCGKECTLPRPFSIHQVNDQGDVALFFAVWENGNGTNWLSQRSKGDRVELWGPLGNGFSVQSGSQNLLLVGGGVGIAPLYFLAQQAIRKKCSVTLIHGASRAAHLYPEPLPSGIKPIMVTDDGSKGVKGSATDLIERHIDRADQIFACGPVAMYQTMAQMPELRTKPTQVSLEVRMGCGRGICYACTINTRRGLKQVCQDGPVFDLDDILWDELNC